ncbi:unnamed protein product, partial [Cyprideis torosa]
MLDPISSSSVDSATAHLRALAINNSSELEASESHEPETSEIPGSHDSESSMITTDSSAVDTLRIRQFSELETSMIFEFSELETPMIPDSSEPEPSWIPEVNKPKMTDTKELDGSPRSTVCRASEEGAIGGEREDGLDNSGTEEALTENVFQPVDDPPVTLTSERYKEILDFVSTLRPQDWYLIDLSPHFREVPAFTLSAILSQWLMEYMKKTHSRRLGSAEVYGRIRKEYRRRLDAGEKVGIMLRLSYKYGVSAACLSKKLLLDELRDRPEEDPKLVDKYLKNTSLLKDFRLAEEVDMCSFTDRFYGPIGNVIKRQKGLDYEAKLHAELKKLGLEFCSEDELRVRGSDKTPDVLLKTPFFYDGVAINWIESKAVFGEPISHAQLCDSQYEKYRNRWESGIVIYWFGFVKDLEVPRGIKLRSSVPPEMEKNVLEAQARRLLEEEERLKEEAEAERIKQEVEAERLKQEAETELLKRDAEAERLKQEAESNSDAPSDLTLRKGAQITNNMSADLNFAEFEGSRDPFDNAELNTLNEIQELASVLCGPTLPHPMVPVLTIPLVSALSSPPPCPYPSLPQPLAFHISSAQCPPRLWILQVSAEEARTDDALYFFNFRLLSHVLRFRPLPFRTCVSPPPNPSDPLSYSSLRSKSVPDLMKELGSEFPQPYPPVALVNHSQVRQTVVPHMNPVPAIAKVPVLPPKPAQNRPRLACPSLKNPYLRLDAEGQKAVDTLVEMGFPWDSSARAVIAFGNDVKNVIEVLLLVESLQERGFPRHLVEHVALESQDK